MIIIHKDHGLAYPWPMAYLNELRKDCRLSIREERYAVGFTPPNFPVPAIRRRVKYSSLYSVLRWNGYLQSGHPKF